MLVPAILYLVATDASMVTIVLFSVWSVVVTVSDGLLKPLLLGRGTDTPMPVVLIGAIGGLLLHGLIGLVIGAVVFSTGYRLFGRWMGQNADTPPGQVAEPAAGPRDGNTGLSPRRPAVPPRHRARPRGALTLRSGSLVVSQRRAR